MAWIKRLGYFYNIAKGSESISNQMSHLIVGVLSGLPAYAMSVRVSVAFYLGALLELPTGVIADVLGHRRTLILGYAICVFASISLFVSCHYSGTVVSFPMLVVSSVLSAAGGCLVSGCLQAFIQDYIDLQIERSREAVQCANELRAKALALSQGYGNFFSAFLPALVLAGVFAIYHLTHKSEWALLLPAAVYGLLSFVLCLVRTDKESRTPNTSSPVHGREYARHLVLFWRDVSGKGRAEQWRMAILPLRMVISILTVIHVHTYLMVSQLRRLDSQAASWKTLTMGFLVLTAFALSHYPKGLIVPIVSKRLSSIRLIYASLMAQSVLAFIALLVLRLGYSAGAVIGFALLFNATFSPGHMTLQSILLASVPEHLRATMFSLVQVVVLIAYGSYSTLLTASGVGVDRPDQILIQLLSLSSIGIALALLFDNIAVNRTAGGLVDDTKI